ncbi:MAG: molybdopterin-binding protein, partial [Mariniblastus sp.]|nr:molybdopterin-binding protein [Mariniblastus sp.]
MTQQARQLTAEVISIGDEMTSGARLDTNAQWLSRRLGNLGIKVSFHTTVADTLEQNVDVFRVAAERVDLMVSTGGLGPTQDDLTREALADLIGAPLELNPLAMQHIEQMFSRRKRDMPERNRVQAMFPIGSQQIFNPQGTAPGIDMVIPRVESGQSRLFALPGVPAEMKRMFDETVAPRILEEKGPGTEIKQHVMKFFGTGESDMENRLGSMIARDREPRVGITVSTATIS